MTFPSSATGNATTISRAFLLAFAILLSSGATSTAQIINFSIDGGNSFGNAFTIGAGSSTTVEVYLSDLPPDDVLATEGLFSLGLAGDVNPNSAGSISAASIDSAFDFVTSQNFNSIAIEWEAAVLANDIPTGSSVRLGDFQFDSSGDGASSFTFGDNRSGAGAEDLSWVTGTGTELDEVIFGTGATNMFSLSFNAAVPEPSAVSLLAMGSMILVVFRRRAISA